MPITPHANLPPALPVVLLKSWPPLPRSSMSACTTTVRPKMLFSPTKDMKESDKFIFAFPSASAVTLESGKKFLPCTLIMKWEKGNFFPEYRQIFPA